MKIDLENSQVAIAVTRARDWGQGEGGSSHGGKKTFGSGAALQMGLNKTCAWMAWG